MTFYENPKSSDGMIIDETANLFDEILDWIGPYRKLMIILDSQGGLISATWRMARLIKERQGSTTTIIPEKAKSAATLIAIASNEIAMFKNAELGPLDPQVSYRGQFVSALDLLNASDPVLRSVAERALEQMREYISLLVNDRELAERLANRLLLRDEQHASHVSPILLDEAKSLGLPLRSETDTEIKNLHNLYKRTTFCEHNTSIIMEYYGL